VPTDEELSPDRTATPSGALPRGLVFFAPGVPPRLRRLKLAAVGVIALVGLSLIWPLYTFFADARPLILGLPLSLAWLVLCLSVVFLALLVLYRAEQSVGAERARETGEEGRTP